MLAVVQGSSWEIWKWPGRGDIRPDLWMIGLRLVLAFTWPWGPCWQLLVNFPHWGHSLTFYLSANYLTFSTYHLLFFKWLEPHPHFDSFLKLPLAVAASKYPCHPMVASLFFVVVVWTEINSSLHNHIKKRAGHFFMAVFSIPQVRILRLPDITRCAGCESRDLSLAFWQNNPQRCLFAEGLTPKNKSLWWKSLRIIRRVQSEWPSSGSIEKWRRRDESQLVDGRYAPTTHDTPSVQTEGIYVCQGAEHRFSSKEH